MKKVMAAVLLVATLLTFSACADSSEEERRANSSEINAAANWATENIWNEGLCIVAYYKLTGLGPSGEKVDIEAVSKLLEGAMGEAAQHNDFIGALSNDGYGELKRLWQVMMGDLDALYSVYYQNRPVAAYDRSYELDTAAFEAALTAFLAEAERVCSI